MKIGVGPPSSSGYSIQPAKLCTLNRFSTGFGGPLALQRMHEAGRFKEGKKHANQEIYVKTSGKEVEALTKGQGFTTYQAVGGECLRHRRRPSGAFDE